MFYNKNGMNPSGENQSINLPAPLDGSAPQPLPAAPAPAPVQPAAPAPFPVNGIQPVAAASPAAPIAASPQAAPTPRPSTAAPAAPAAASGAQGKDSIEKEWVEKAKRIVEQTRNDPHKQSDELTLVKADYMKQRYNKTIKVSK